MSTCHHEANDANNVLETFQVMQSAGEDLFKYPIMLSMLPNYESRGHVMGLKSLDSGNSVSHWMVRELSQECSVQLTDFYLEWWHYFLRGALAAPGACKLVQEILRMCPREAIQNAVCD